MYIRRKATTLYEWAGMRYYSRTTAYMMRLNHLCLNVHCLHNQRLQQVSKRPACSWEISVLYTILKYTIYYSIHNRYVCVPHHAICVDAD